MENIKPGDEQYERMLLSLLQHVGAYKNKACKQGLDENKASLYKNYSEDFQAAFDLLKAARDSSTEPENKEPFDYDILDLADDAKVIIEYMGQLCRVQKQSYNFPDPERLYKIIGYSVQVNDDGALMWQILIVRTDVLTINGGTWVNLGDVDFVD